MSQSHNIEDEEVFPVGDGSLCWCSSVLFNFQDVLRAREPNKALRKRETIICLP